MPWGAPLQWKHTFQRSKSNSSTPQWKKGISERRSINSFWLWIATGCKADLADHSKQTGGLQACCKVSRSSGYPGSDASYPHSCYLNEELINAEHGPCSKQLAASGKSVCSTKMNISAQIWTVRTDFWRAVAETGKNITYFYQSSQSITFTTQTGSIPGSRIPVAASTTLPPKKTPSVSTLRCLKAHLQWMSSPSCQKAKFKWKRNSRGVNEWICTDAFKVRQLKIDYTYGCCKTFPLTVGLQWAYCERLPLSQLVKHQLPLRLIHPTCLKSHVGQSRWKNTMFSLLAACCSLGGVRFSSGHNAAVKEKS